jgi:hypothetical protein
MGMRNANLQWQYHQARKYLTRIIYSRLYRDSNRDTHKSIMVAGTARSGTTWLASIIASQIPCRVMFEPFQSEMVAQFRDFHYFQYMRPHEPNAQLWAFCTKVFTGGIRHRWIDREVSILFPKYRLIKEIRANLFLQWIHTNFPEVPLVFIVRHPCAVVSSRLHLKWATDADIAPMLAQQHLVNDFLSDTIDMIRSASTDEEKHAIIWCISNLVPIQQFGAGQLNVVFYEHLCLQPEIEIPNLFRAIGHLYQRSVFDSVSKPSTTSSKVSAVVTGQNKVMRWRKELSSQQIDCVLNVVEKFGLDHLYGDSYMPLDIR